jgi:ribosomal-protein-alanine N-acetyltransferase
MSGQPDLVTERLYLRLFTLCDASAVQRLAGERDIAATTAAMPHPYEDGMAEACTRNGSPAATRLCLPSPAGSTARC